ncbi:hypothetical protein K8R43_00575 [archaeon]|nr:hypothetical protein [archaeon]
MKTKHLFVLLYIAIILVPIFVILMITYATSYKCSSPIAHDKSACAASEIKLHSYVENQSYTKRFFDAEDASGKLVISYNDTEMICKEGTSNSPVAVCTIGATVAADTWIRVYVDGEECLVESVKGEVDSGFCGCGKNCNPYASNETLVTITQVLLALDIIFILILVASLVNQFQRKT